MEADIVVRVSKADVSYTFRRSAEHHRGWFVTSIKRGEVEQLEKIRLARDEMTPHLDEMSRYLFEG